MGNIAGRSKGCDNCRRRRIRCDLSQPACRRCTKAGIKCGGSRGITFIHYGAQQSTTCVISQTSSSSLQRTPKVSSVTLAYLPRSLLGVDLGISHDELFVNYTRANLLHNIESDKIGALETSCRLSDASLLALATIFFGTEHGDSAVIQRGLQRYNSTIEEINSALRDSDYLHSPDLFNAILTMSLLEFHISERDRGWLNHANGLERLLELRGPDSFTSFLDLVLLEQARPIVLFAALTFRKPTILSSTVWKAIPWSLFPERKGYMQMLLDILADCAGLFAAKTDLESNPFQSLNSDKRQDLTFLTEAVLSRLDRIEAAWISANLNCVWEVESPALTPPIPYSETDQAPMWTTFLQYQSLEHADLATMGSAVRILALLIYRDLPEEMTTTSAQKYSSQLFNAIITICRSLNYQFQETNKGASSHAMFYPIKVAYKASMYDYPIIGNWLKSILDRLSDGFAAKWTLATQHIR